MATSTASVDKTAVLDQLERMLGSTVFRGSKRHSSLLRYLVERTLAGSAANLRERTLGVEVFGRPADYDNYADPVVRISAGEVRKRIAQYYHEAGREKELRIELPLGSYVPEFHDPVLTPSLPVEAAEPAVRRIPRMLPVWVGAGVLVVVMALWRPWVPAGSIEQFWRPFLDSDSPVTICLARVPFPARSGNVADRPRLIAWYDSSTSTKVASMIQSLGQHHDLRLDDGVTFQDLRRRPAVLIGAFNDPWTLRLTENLRFEFRRDDNSAWIFDRKNPSSRSWTAGAGGRDYAVISRLLTGRSGKPVLTVAGIGGLGTEAAGDFVTNRLSLDTLARKASAGWQTRNMQIVIGTEVIEGHFGPPSIEAIEIW